MSFSALIFDMDGLLVDSEPVWNEVEVELVESCGYVYSQEVRELGIGMRIDEFAVILQQHYPKLGSTPAAIEAAITQGMLRQPAERIRVRPGAEELVRYVADLGIPRAIASSSPQVIIEHFVALLGWADLIPHRYSAETLARGKPAPDIFLHTADQLGFAPESCLALEDSRLGTIAALRAGMTCYSVPDLSHSRLADFAEINNKIYGSLHEVLDNLKGKGTFA